jgi:hypothetical protein
MNRRTFLSSAAGTLSAAAAPVPAAEPAPERAAAFAVDFRYAPLRWQTAYCYPDDTHKSLVGDRGQLLCGHPGQGGGIERFPSVIEFTLAGGPDGTVRQELEAPGVPIVRTRVERATATLELRTFATRREGEGRVDNVVVSVTPKGRASVYAQPLVTVRTRETLAVARADGLSTLLAGAEKKPVLVSNRRLALSDNGWGYTRFAR